MKNRRGFLLILLASFTLIIVVIFQFNKINRREIKAEFEALTIAEGLTIKNLLETSGLNIIEHGEVSLRKFLDSLYKNQSILYIGLLKNGSLVYLLSRYEGFFPVAGGKEGHRFLDSPVGKIFEIRGGFKNNRSDDLDIYIGFNYRFLTSFEKSAGKNFFMITGIIFLIMVFVVIIILYYDKKFFNKNLELIREKEEKERLMELSLLTSEISHEIKNPLNSIYLSFNTMEQYLSDNEDAVFYKNAVKSEIKRISEIINSYSALSRNVEVNYSIVNIEKLIDEFRILKKPEMEQKRIGCEIISNVDKFITDRDLFIQILLNLVNNAMEAEAKNIQIELSKDRGLLLISVKDDGRGIDPENWEKIFKPYVSSKTKGMGLGLHITLKNVRALNGDIKLLSGEDGDKIFMVTLKEGQV